MTTQRKTELREAAITTVELLKGFTPEQREEWDNATHSVEELANCILELTAPESSPSPLESQEELWRDLWNYWDTDATKDELQSKFILTRRTEGGLEK